jgi:hypothetical protein
MEYENKYASKGVAGAGLGLGIAGTALGLLNNGVGLNILGGGSCRNNGCDSAMTAAAMIAAGNNHNCCTAPAYTRYDAEKDARIAELETEVKLRDANTYTLGEVGKLRDYMENRLGVIEREICDQRTYNAVNTATISCIQGQIATLLGLTKTVIPNGSICPGWGNVTVTPAAAPAAGA